MRFACNLLGVTVGLPYSFCDQIGTVVKATIHKGEGLNNFALLSKTHDLEQPHVDSVWNGSHQIEHLETFTCHFEAERDDVAHRVRVLSSRV
jgi:hypothetical protein